MKLTEQERVVNMRKEAKGKKQIPCLSYSHIPQKMCRKWEVNACL